MYFKQQQTGIASLLSIVCLSACSFAPTIWDKAGGSQESFNRDQMECKYDAMRFTQVADPGMQTIFGQELDKLMRQKTLIKSCMESRGYTAQQ